MSQGPRALSSGPMDKSRTKAPLGSQNQDAIVENLNRSLNCPKNKGCFKMLRRNPKRFLENNEIRATKH